jgi:hypothetical protein
MWKHALPVMISCLAVTASAQSAQHIPAKITIRTEATAAFAGAPINVTVELWNISDHPIQLDIEYANGTDVTYGFHVGDQEGAPSKAAQVSKDEVILGETRTATLQPNQRDIRSICLSCLYGNLSAPGKYTIYIVRTVHDNGKAVDVKSNELTIAVLPKKAVGPR